MRSDPLSHICRAECRAESLHRTLKIFRECMADAGGLRGASEVMKDLQGEITEQVEQLTASIRKEVTDGLAALDRKHARLLRIAEVRVEKGPE